MPDMEGLSLCDDEEKIEEAKEFSKEDKGGGEEEEEEEEPEELYAESFMVKGSVHEECYQQALLKCDEAKRKKKHLFTWSSNLIISRTRMPSN